MRTTTEDCSSDATTPPSQHYARELSGRDGMT
ncbi:hypothetical protein MXAN_3088 [Myxococcus xanthus DK 1622]|uniref:Uncharacterized protein n=1 Tax=Myxococcus xanthus (strain DK1622) TaxID=246197 RepID=Q1D7T2_MYXXD|nr:hypothetical protein MXAN_3088 [Myxococcus xanthus DK 1622]